jgi:trans-aconitate methyltransferase
VSEALLAQARRRLPTSVATRADLRELELHASFDAIACRGVLNDLVDDENRDAVLIGFAAIYVVAVCSCSTFVTSRPQNDTSAGATWRR